MAYTGSSIVDYLGSLGQASDFGSRTNLAKQYGIVNYSGTADQNTQLLNTLRTKATTPPAGAVPAAPVAPTVQQPTYQQPNTPAGTPPAVIKPPTIDPQAFIQKIQSGQINPDQINQLISDEILNAYKTTYGGGTGNNRYLNEYSDTGTKLADSVRASLNGQTFNYNGQTYQYSPTGTRKLTTTVNQSTTGANGTTVQPTAAVPPAGGIPMAPQVPGPMQAPQPPVPGAPVAPVIPGAPAVPIAPTAPAPVAPSIPVYQGASIVEYLNSIGQASDYNTRSQLAAELGITGYTGTAAQNTQMLQSLRDLNGNGSAPTAVAGANFAGNGGSSTVPNASKEGINELNLGEDTRTILENAQAIAKQFGWTAPDPQNSPLNIATNLFNQGLQSFGLNDLKTEISNTIKAQSELNNKKSQEIADVNSNPWLTEGERIQRIRNIDGKYETRLDTLINTLQLYDSQYKTGLDQVQWQVGQAMDAYQSAESGNEKTLSEALSIAEKIQEARAKENKPVELSAGATLYDPKTGKAIITAPGKAIGASSNGGYVSPVTQSVIENPSLFYNLTPTQKGQILGELQANGYDVSQLQNTKLSASQTDDIANMNTVSGLITQVLNFNNDGKLEGIDSLSRGSLYSFAAQLGLPTSAEGMQVRALIGNIQGTIAKIRGGTSFTENEQRLLETYTPKINDNPTVAINKLNLLRQFIALKNSDLISAAKTNITTGQITKKGGEAKVESLRAKYKY